MKIVASVEKRIFGTIEVDIPDEKIIGASVQARKRRVNAVIAEALNDPVQRAAIQWDDDMFEPEIFATGNFSMMSNLTPTEQERNQEILEPELD